MSQSQAASGQGIPHSLCSPFCRRWLHHVWAELVGPGSNNSKDFLCSSAVISENPLIQLQLAFGYLEHRNHCQHHSLDSAYWNILWGFFFGWVLFCFGVGFFVFHWKEYSETLVPWWWIISPYLVCHAPSELTGVHRLLFQAGPGYGWLSKFWHLYFLQVYNSAIIYHSWLWKFVLQQCSRVKCLCPEYWTSFISNSALVRFSGAQLCDLYWCVQWLDLVACISSTSIGVENSLVTARQRCRIAQQLPNKPHFFLYITVGGIYQSQFNVKPGRSHCSISNCKHASKGLSYISLSS